MTSLLERNNNKSDLLVQRLEKLDEQTLRQLLKDWMCTGKDASRKMLAVYARLRVPAQVHDLESARHLLKQLDIGDVFLLAKTESRAFHPWDRPETSVVRVYDQASVVPALFHIPDIACSLWLQGQAEASAALLQAWLNCKVPLADLCEREVGLLRSDLKTLCILMPNFSCASGYVLALFVHFANIGSLHAFSCPFQMSAESIQEVLSDASAWPVIRQDRILFSRFLAALIESIPLTGSHADKSWPLLAEACLPFLLDEQICQLMDSRRKNRLLAIPGFLSRSIVSLPVGQRIPEVHRQLEAQDVSGQDRQFLLETGLKEARQQNIAEAEFYFLSRRLVDKGRLDDYVALALHVRSHPASALYFTAAVLEAMQYGYGMDAQAIRYLSGLLDRSNGRLAAVKSLHLKEAEMRMLVLLGLLDTGQMPEADRSFLFSCLQSLRPLEAGMWEMLIGQRQQAYVLSEKQRKPRTGSLFVWLEDWLEMRAPVQDMAVRQKIAEAGMHRLEQFTERPELIRQKWQQKGWLDHE